MAEKTNEQIVRTKPDVEQIPQSKPKHYPEPTPRPCLGDKKKDNRTRLDD